MSNVLIVDDSPDAVVVTTELLESAGHRVQTGYNGEEGLKSLTAGPLPDCVLLDVDMPVLNGPGMAHQMLLHDAGEERIPRVRTGRLSKVGMQAEHQEPNAPLANANIVLRAPRSSGRFSNSHTDALEDRPRENKPRRTLRSVCGTKSGARQQQGPCR
jgi:CheY-like chemotaxis protein